jgi:hypothetical protein
MCRDFGDGVFSAAARAESRKTNWVLDKTPNHASCARLLAEVYPDAAYVQIIRNPRDAISSARDLWSDWNPRLRSWQGAATDWKNTVEDCRTHLSGLRYHEVRYEDLLAEPEKEFAAILDAVGLPHDPSYVEQAVEFGRAPVNVRPSDQRISDAKWADIERAAERDIVEVAGDLMVELGYLSGDERERILAEGATWRAVRRGGRQLAQQPQRALRHAGRLARRSRATGPEQRRATVKDVATRATSAAVQGDAGTLAALLRPNVELDHDGDVTRGAAVVAAALCTAMTDASVTPFMFDERAAAVEVVVSGAPRQHHRYYVHRGQISRIVIEGGK